VGAANQPAYLFVPDKKTILRFVWQKKLPEYKSYYFRRCTRSHFEFHYWAFLLKVHSNLWGFQKTRARCRRICTLRWYLFQGVIFCVLGCRELLWGFSFTPDRLKAVSLVLGVSLVPFWRKSVLTLHGIMTHFYLSLDVEVCAPG
jgi:hypothetical protein